MNGILLVPAVVLLHAPSLPSGAGASMPQIADTVLAMPGRDGFDLIFGVTAGIIGLTFLAVLLVFLVLLLQARKISRAIDEGRKRFAQDRGVEYLRRTAENLEKISRTLRDEAEALRGSGQALSERFLQVSDRMEERIDEFNALMEVIQDEAEGIFVDTASTARGLRKGLGKLGDGRARGRRATPTSRAAGRTHREGTSSALPEGGTSIPDTQVTSPSSVRASTAPPPEEGPLPPEERLPSRPPSGPPPPPSAPPRGPEETPS